MHPDPAFRQDDDTLHDLLFAAAGFGTVFAQTPAGPRVAHTPLVYTPGNGSTNATVRFHLSCTNALTPYLDGATALILVNGPGAYVSPRWYEDHGQVPTWNYVALELEGPVRSLPPEGLADLLGEIGAQHEARLAGENAWRPEHVPAERWAALFAAITGFVMEVHERRSTFKLSQNKSDEDRERVADALEAEGSPGIAHLMRSIRAVNTR